MKRLTRRDWLLIIGSALMVQVILSLLGHHTLFDDVLAMFAAVGLVIIFLQVVIWALRLRAWYLERQISKLVNMDEVRRQARERKP